MALEQKYKHCQTCSTITIVDTTGPYDEDTNPTGYGAPNLTFEEAGPRSAVFTTPAGATFEMELIPVEPNEEGNYLWTFGPDSFGMSEFIRSGVWNVHITSGEAENRKYVLFDGHIEKLIRTELLCSGRCGEVNMSDMNKLSGAKFLMNSCGDREAAQEQIEWLYANYKKCKC